MDEGKIQFEAVDAQGVDAAQGIEIGSRIGPYEVREHIGDGGMAAVYKAWHTGLHRFEALKIPRHQYTYGPEAAFLQRLLAEARTAARLHHPHIVAIHNVSEVGAMPQYFAMDFVAGVDLAGLLNERGRLMPSEAIPMLAQVGSALDYAHAHGVVHRDIKPGNILLQPGPDGQVAKVVDFGISRAGEDSGGTRLTKSGMMVGTPEYMSPEQAGSGDPVDYRTDIYSLGIVAYEALAGHPPFTVHEGVSRISILMKHMREPPVPLVDVLPDLPAEVSNVIGRALAKQPADRYATCKAFTDDLEQALGMVRPREGNVVTAAAVLAPGGGRPEGAETAMYNLGLGGAGIPPGEQSAVSLSPTKRYSTILAGLGGLVAGLLINYYATEIKDGPLITAHRLIKRHGTLRAPLNPAAIEGESLPLKKGELLPPKKWHPVAAYTAVSHPAWKAKPAKIAAARMPMVRPKRPYPVPAKTGLAHAPTVAPKPVHTMAAHSATVRAQVPFNVVHVHKYENIYFPLHTVWSASLPRGRRSVRQAGRLGVREVKLDVTYNGKREVLRRVILNRINRQALPEVVVVGTRSAPAHRKVSYHPAPHPYVRRLPKVDWGHDYSRGDSRLP